MTSSQSDTELKSETQLDTEPVLDQGDHERYSHYVKKDKIVQSAVLGSPVRALCGKTWVPNRDPKKFPICPTCQAIYERLSGDENEKQADSTD
jgi:hypothetical protein